MEILICILIACVISALVPISLYIYFKILCKKWDNVEIIFEDGKLNVEYFN